VTVRHVTVRRCSIAQGRRHAHKPPPVDVRSAALFLAFAATGSDAADIFSLKSTTFEDGKLMPKKVANSKANQPNNPNCVGDNVSPQFSWENPPDGTKSFAMMMFDPEGRSPAPPPSNQFQA
jgi:phosphatidylethanolamine-binding protein (PEBP) family uncharacterized protein